MSDGPRHIKTTTVVSVELDGRDVMDVLAQWYRQKLDLPEDATVSLTRKNSQDIPPIKISAEVETKELPL